MGSSADEVTLPCPDLGRALAFFTDELGLRLDAIFPADDPARAELSGHGVRIQLRRQPVPERTRGTGWVEGRAGMQYRDLVPDRDGGHVIASHIRIAHAGPVPDYVHYHEVRFQLIYCRRGWVRVVYEGQGPPFVLRAGDCVLQPPAIRHRVLASSAGLEVIEVGSPAEHTTRVDHELALPTATLDPDRDFSGQRFVRHVVSEATWQPWRLPGLEQRDLGIGEATRGLASACVVRRGGCSGSAPASPEQRRALWVVLSGALTLRDDAGEHTRLVADQARVLPAGRTWSLVDSTEDLELLEVTLPDRASGS
jgi:mannose-6-phosphate isomerase-like protein (cupin superfamily)